MTRRLAPVALAASAALALPVAVERAERRPAGRSLAPHRVAASGAAVRVRGRGVRGDVNVSRARGAQAEVAIAVDPSRPAVLVAGSASYASASRVYGSANGGRTWTSRPLPPPRGTCSYGDPAVAIGPDGRQFYAFLAGSCDGQSERISLALATRRRAGAPWSSRLLRIEGATAMSDKNALAVDVSAASPYAGRLYLAWSRLFAPTASYEVVVSHSDDDGATWSRAVRVSGARRTYQTYASLAVGDDGTLYVAWLTEDGRVLLDRSDDGGDHFRRDLPIASLPFTGASCPFAGSAIPAQATRCAAPAPQVTADAAHGRVHVTYAARTPGGTGQDVWVRSFDAATLSALGTRRRVNPPDGRAPSDQFLPASTVDATTGRLWACWYDTRGDPTRRRARYTCSSSADGGTTWTLPRRAAHAFSDETARAASPFQYGDYAGVAAAAGVAHPIWTDSRRLGSLGEEIYANALQLP